MAQYCHVINYFQWSKFPHTFLNFQTVHLNRHQTECEYKKLEKRTWKIGGGGGIGRKSEKMESFDNKKAEGN